MLICGLDIETLPNLFIPKEAIPQFDPSEVKTGNMGLEKAQEKIEKVKSEFNDKLVKTMSIDPALAQLCTFVGIIYDCADESIKSECLLQLTPEEHENNDYSIVFDAWAFIQSAYLQKIPLVSFNGIGFDLPVLLFRAMLQDVAVSKKMYDNFVRRYQNIYHYDLMNILANWDKTRWNKLDFYLRIFGIGTKTEGMSGDKVYPAYMAGEYQKILDYCKDDVKSTCKLFANIQHWIYYQQEAVSEENLKKEK